MIFKIHSLERESGQLNVPAWQVYFISSLIVTNLDQPSSFLPIFVSFYIFLRIFSIPCQPLSVFFFIIFGRSSRISANLCQSCTSFFFTILTCTSWQARFLCKQQMGQLPTETQTNSFSCFRKIVAIIIRDGGSTAQYTAYMAGSVDIVDTVDTIDTVDIVYTV